MAKSIRIFKSFEEQDKYRKESMFHSSAKERFQQLYIMQQLTGLLHPNSGNLRKITVRKWTF
jgi:hypothetical protein